MKNHAIVPFAKKILGGRYSILLVACIAGLVSLSFLPLGWMFDDMYHRLVMRNTDAVREYVPDKFSFDPLRGYYVFLDQNPERTNFLKDRGLVPWWANDKTYVAFWRPLSSFTYLLDFSVWPESPVMFHLHNGLWFVALSIVSMLLFRRLLLPSWIAGLAGLVFILNGSALMPVAWIANRHTLVAMTFGLCSFLFFDMHHTMEIRQKTNMALAFFFFTLSLFASELGIVVFAFILAYTIFLSDESVKKKTGIIGSFIVIIVLWRILYTLLGFGVKGSEIYIDPIGSPIEFLMGIPLKVPFILADSLLGIPADIYGYISANAIPAFAIGLLAVSLLVAGFVLKKHAKKNRFVYFWISCILFAMIPLCASAPAQRHLTIISFCTIGLVLSLFAAVIERQREETRRTSRGRFILLAAILSIKLASGIVGVFLVPVSVNTIRSMSAEFLDFGKDPALKDRDVVIVSPPIIHFLYSLTVERLFTGLPMPAHVRVLSPPFTDIAVTRTGTNSISITADKGYYQPPLPFALPPQRTQMSLVPFPFPDFFNPLYSYFRLDRIFLDSSYRPGKGDTIRLSNITITVTGLTDDRRISSAQFDFSVPLEDPSLLFITWDAGAGKYIPFEISEIGESTQVNQY